MTATQLQFRRGTAAQMATFTGAPGEVVVDTSNNRVVVHDGATAGGWPAARIAEVAPQCGRLSFVSTTQIKFAPFNGAGVKIAGLLYTIPSAGVTAANTSVYVNGVAGQNLAASTLYYVYLFNNAGTLTVDFSTTAHASDTATGNVGVEIKSGDNSRTLIGMVYANASAQFADAQNTRFVASWFSRRSRALAGVALGAASTGSVNVFVELSSTARAQFICWGDEDIEAICVGQVSCVTTPTTVYANLGNGTVQNVAPNAAFAFASTNVGCTVATMLCATFSEGYSYLTPTGCVATSGATGDFWTQALATLRI